MVGFQSDPDRPAHTGPGSEESGAGSWLGFVRRDEPRPSPTLRPEAAIAEDARGMAPSLPGHRLMRWVTRGR